MSSVVCLLVPFSLSETPLDGYIFALLSRVSVSSSPSFPLRSESPVISLGKVLSHSPLLLLLWILFLTLSCLLRGVCVQVCMEPQLIMGCLGLLYEGRLGCPMQGKPFFSANQSHAKALSMPKGPLYNVVVVFKCVYVCFICVWIGVCECSTYSGQKRVPDLLEKGC